MADPSKDKSEALFRAFGRYVNSLNGRYITAEDVGIDVNDMEWVLKETDFVTGVHQVHGGSGDPSPFTAYGTLQGLMATLNAKFGNEEVGKYSYAVQGVGHVGMEYVKLLREHGDASTNLAAKQSVSTISTTSMPMSIRPAHSAARSTTAPSRASSSRPSVVPPTTNSLPKTAVMK